MSVVSSFLAKATTLVATAGTGGAAVPVYFGEAGLRSTAGVHVDLPFIVIEDRGAAPDYEFEYGGTETTTLDVTVFAITLAQVDSIVLALKYGGGVPSAQDGLDFAETLTSLGSYLSFEECKRVGETRNRDHQSYTPQAQIAHSAKLTYEVKVTITDS